MTLELTSTERRALRARAHHLHPAISIGGAGLTTAVLNEINKHLSGNDLLKIRVFSDTHATRHQWLDEICTTLHAAPVQHVGKTLVVYRPLAEDPGATPKSPQFTRSKRRAPRRTKRSFQR